jgi:hypothetical protein
VRQALAAYPDMVQGATTTLVVEGQLTWKVIGKLNGLTVAKGPKILR